MDELDLFWRLRPHHLKPSLHHELFKQYVCRSMSQEGLGTVDVTVVEEILQCKSRDSTTLEYQDTLGFTKAYQYLWELSQCEDAGLLDNNVICEVHKILMDHRSHLCTVGKYSGRQRVVEFGGNLHFYASPWNMEESMQMLIDEYNHRWFTLNQTVDNRKALEDLVHLTAWLVYKFLELHPFGDGKGRTARLLYTYIMESYGFPFPVSPLLCSKNENEHHAWCQILHNVRLTGNVEELELCMINSLQTSCKEYESLNKTH